MNGEIQDYPCPVCGYLVFEQPPGSHKCCPVCGWEDNLAQLRFPLMSGGANVVSLQRAQENFNKYSAATRQLSGLVRGVISEDRRDPDWRCLDPESDNVEEPQRGIDYAESYPDDDPTVMYYWRASYWRRISG